MKFVPVWIACSVIDVVKCIMVTDKVSVTGNKKVKRLSIVVTDQQSANKHVFSHAEAHVHTL